MNQKQKDFIMNIIQKRMSVESKPTDPVKLLKKQSAERILAGVGSRADSSLVGYKVSDLTAGPKQAKKDKETEEKANKKIADKKKSEKQKLEEKVAAIAIKSDNFKDTTPEEDALIENIPPDSIEAYKNRVIERQLDKLGIDSSKVKTDTKPEPKKKSGIFNFLENNKRKSAVRRIINRADYRKAKDNPQLQAQIMKAELAKKGYTEEEIIDIIQGL